MKRLSIVLSVLILASVLGAWPRGAAAQESQPVVHAVLFYSPTCGHCEYVIKEVLPPLYEKYGPQLQIIGFDVSTPQGQAMFMSALEHFGVKEGGVPFLVIDDLVLVGSQQIPEELPVLVEAYLTMGGVDWPGIPGLREMLISAAQTATAEPSGVERAAGCRHGSAGRHANRSVHLAAAFRSGCHGQHDRCHYPRCDGRGRGLGRDAVQARG